MSDPLWPELSWTPSGEKVEWLIDRTHELAVRARGFELALEQASEAGEANLSRLADDLAEWEKLTANIWMSSGLEDAEGVTDEAVPRHADALAKVYRNLIDRRRSILAKLGAEASAKLQAREETVDVTEGEAGESDQVPQFGGETDLLGTQLPFIQLPGHEIQRPVSSDELRMRQTAESKQLPESGNLGALLSILPSEWVTSIFETLGLAAPGDEEMTAGSRSAFRRGVIHEHLLREDFLREIALALDEEDRTLLVKLMEAGKPLPYNRITAEFGKDDADGFFWGDRRPSGPLARLRRTGLAFVAMRFSQQLVQTPVDVAAKLKTVLASLESETGADEDGDEAAES